jgi:cobalt/nickel transport system permease protein
VEGVVTVAVLSFLRKARPDLVEVTAGSRGRYAFLSAAFLACAIIVAGGLSCFASKNPDGLEWALAKVTGHTELEPPQHGLYPSLAALQKKTALLSGYQLPKAPETRAVPKEVNKESDAGTGAAGIIGTLLTLIAAFGTGFLLKRRNDRPCYNSSPHS